MSLYDDLDGIPMQTPSADDSGELSGWSSSLKLMQTQLQRKRVVQNKPTSAQKSTVVNSVILDRGLKRAHEEQEDTRPLVNTDSFINHSLQSSIKEEPFIETDASMVDVVDEYDPLKPNDYETVKERHRELREKEKRESREKERSSRDSERDRDRDSYRDRDYDRSYDRERDHERERDRDSRERDRDRERRRDRHRDDDDDSSHRRSAKRTGGAAIAPPTFLTEESIPKPEQEEEAFEPSFDRRPFQPLFNPEKPSVGFNSPIASQIMAKYGWKDGQGLGKSEQGINTCLQVEKTSKRGGKIINKDKESKAQAQEPESIVNTMKNPSKVVLLRNMVGPGEVDDDLQPETAEECAKYGEVSKVIIYEIPEGVVEEEAVRIFVEFQRVESAIKAVVDLNGRYFGGRTVKATFYNLDKFRRLDLADDL